MNNLLKNPLFWVGAVIGVRWLYKNKPDSKLTRVFEELEEGATNLAYQTAEYAGDVIDTGADTLSDSIDALGWNMQDGDDMPGDDVGAEGVNAVGGELPVTNGDDASEIPTDDEGGNGVDSNGGSIRFSGDELPGDELGSGVSFTNRRNPLPTHSNFSHSTFEESKSGDVELIGISNLGQPVMSEWNEDAEGSGNSNTGLSGVGAFTPESAVDTASDRVRFRNDGSAMSFNDFDY
jgi:hypothetical protein